jgi:hypothetical protein
VRDGPKLPYDLSDVDNRPMRPREQAARADPTPRSGHTPDFRRQRA